MRLYHNLVKLTFSSLLILSSLSSCCFQRLSVSTDYIGRETLASFQIDTPDPLLYHPPTGQRLIVKWHIPHAYLEYDDLHLAIEIRFRDRSKQTLSIPICHTAGNYVYPVLGDRYLQTQGILSYHVQLLGSDEVLEEWTHPLWTTLIELNSELYTDL